jgi:hypothetical protein
MLVSDLQLVFSKLDNEVLLELLGNDTLDALSVIAIRRVLRDRLEGLDDVVRVQLLSNKIVGA